jgi:hypothetical protein|tara:strand:+ start:262 stop:528 length:267 start_codon:yes stop_codon:yes gene_type:complete
MNRHQILEKIINEDSFDDDEIVVLADGFEDAFVGVTITKPKKVIYDYWKCLDCIIKKEDLEFDEALDFLDEFVLEDLGRNTPIYIEQL